MKLLPAILVATLACGWTIAEAQPRLSIATASPSGTYIEIGRDLARIVGAPAGISMNVLPSRGSADNVHLLDTDDDVRLALVQSDVYQALTDEAASGSADAARLIKPLRVVLPLFDEEIYFVVNADSPLQSVSDIEGRRINIGPVGSGTALTATTLYRAMFGHSLPERDASYLPNEQALVKLVTDRSVDVVVIVAAQPAKLIRDMKVNARNYIKLLGVRPDAPQTQQALGPYNLVTVRAASYPNLLSSDVQALSVRSLLITRETPSASQRDTLSRFANSLCNNFYRLQSEGHAKWQEVALAQPALPRGWNYFAPTHRAIATCGVPTHASPLAEAAPSQPPRCTSSRELLGLCTTSGK
jgi:TRAP transporter TAXI family solute receptor